MSLFGSMFSGVSGLAAQSQAMAVISNNVANVNTTAYKRAGAEFSTLVTGSASAATFNPGGVRPHTAYSITQQGLLQASESPTDVSISGNGFFVVNSQADGRAEQLYTRAGSFTADYLGNLRTTAGFYVQGWTLDADGEIADPNTLTTVNVRGVGGVAAATTVIEIGASLDAGQAAHTDPYAAGDLAAHAAGAGGVQPHFSRPVLIYDALGAAHNVTLAFLKSDAAPNTWSVEVHAGSGEVDLASHPNGLLATGTVTFNGDGTLAATAITPVYPAAAGAGDPIGINWANGANDSTVALELGTAGAADGLSQFDGGFAVAHMTQNGAEVGQLNGVTIDDDGYVIGSFTNGRQQKLYKLPVATFANPAALDPRTGNVYAQTNASGTVNLQHAGRGSAGAVVPSSLEAANVDLADEFTRMIVTQRAYSANARIITTTDEMLDELMRIKR